MIALGPVNCSRLDLSNAKTKKKERKKTVSTVSVPRRSLAEVRVIKREVSSCHDKQKRFSDNFRHLLPGPAK